jgi:flagellar biosynthesis/type III secretory pathway protein FliH
MGAAVTPLRLPSLRGGHGEGAAAARLVVERRRGPAGLAPGEGESLREQARAQGLDMGLREGRAAAQAEWAARLERVTRALEEATLALLASRVELAAQVERQLPKLVMALGRKVIHQELSVSQTAAQTVVRGIAERLGGCEGAVVVKLNPQMVDAFEEWRRSDQSERPAGPRVRVESDGALGAGEWLLETGDGFLDGRVESQLEEAWRFLEGLPR